MSVQKGLTKLLTKVAISIGNRLSSIPVDPLQCWLFTLHEPELPEEILIEMANLK